MAKNTILNDIFRTLDGWDDYTNRITVLRDQLAARRVPERTALERGAEITDRILNAAATKKPDLTRIFDDMRTDDARRETRNKELDLIARAIKRAENELDQFEKAHIADVVDELRTRISATADRLADLGTIPSSAEQAIATDSIDAWKNSQGIADELETLIRAYLDATRNLVDTGDLPKLLAGALIADPAAYVPDMVSRRISAARAIRERSANHAALAEWFEAAQPVPAGMTGNISGSTIIPNGADRVQWLSHLARNGQLTARQPDEALTVHRAALNAITAPRVAATSAVFEAWASISEYAAAIGDEDTAADAEDRARDAQGKPRRARRAA